MKKPTFVEGGTTLEEAKPYLFDVIPYTFNYNQYTKCLRDLCCSLSLLFFFIGGF